MAYIPKVLDVADGGTGVITSTGINIGSGTSALTNITYTDVTSWSPNLQFGGANVGITYTTQLGRYVRFGNAVYFWLKILLSSKGSSTGTVTISNFPFTFAVTARVPVNYWTVITTPSSFPGMYLNCASAGIIISPQLTGTAGGGASGMDDTHFANTSGFATSGVVFI